MVVITVENVVVSGTLAVSLDLSNIASRIKETKYNSNDFPGLTYYLDGPKTTTLLFEDGKIISTGAKSIEDACAAVEIIAQRIKEVEELNEISPEVNIQNIVTSTELGAELNLEAISMSMPQDDMEYNPERFPGIVYRANGTGVTMLLFGSGKIVTTGGTTPEEVESAIDGLIDELKALGMLKNVLS